MSRKLTRLDFGRHEHLYSLLRKPIEEIEEDYSFTGDKMKQALLEAERRVTVHLYQLHRRGRGKTVRDLFHAPGIWNQIHLAVTGEDVTACYTGSWSSNSRALHSQMVNFYLENPQLQEETISAVVVTHNYSPGEHYFHRGFSFVTHSLGSNWPGDIHEFRDKVKASGIPYSYGGRGHVGFVKEGETTIVYQGMEEDIWQMDFDRRMREAHDSELA